MPEAAEKQHWLNRTVLGVGLTSLLSDWSYEIPTSILPAFLAAIGAGPAWLGAIEGISGILLCGVSTAFIFAIVNAMFQLRIQQSASTLDDVSTPTQ